MKWLLRILVFLAAVTVGAAFWLLETGSGLRWALGFAPQKLAVENPRGALAREIGADRVAWEGIEARNVSFELNLFALLVDTVSVQFVRIDSLVVTLKPSDGQPVPPLPVRIKVSDAQLKSLVVEGYEANDVRLDYSGSPLGHEVSGSFRAAGARAK